MRKTFKQLNCKRAKTSREAILRKCELRFGCSRLPIRSRRALSCNWNGYRVRRTVLRMGIRLVQFSVIASNYALGVEVFIW